MNNEEIRVYQNIEESPIYYEYDNFTFYFSSAFYRRNFKLRVEQYIKEETYRLKNRYKVINEKFFNDFLKEVLLISFYKKIEKRGFRVYLNEVRYKENGK